VSFVDGSATERISKDTTTGAKAGPAGQSAIVGAGSTAGNSAVAAVLADLKDPAKHEAAAIADPGGYVRQVAHSSWDDVRANYKKGLLQFNPAGNDKKKGTVLAGAKAMNHLLWFRLSETLQKEVPNSVMNQVKPEVEAEQRRRQADREARLKGAKAPPLRPLDWNYGAGSGTATSDIDSNLQGDATEFAVRRFNAVFRGRWGGKESGRVFDLNVYARDYLPESGGGSLFGAKQSADSKSEKPGPLAPGTMWAERGVVFETAALERGKAPFEQAMSSQEVFSLMKTRRDMSFFDWTRYKREQLAGLKGSAHDKKADAVRKAEELYEQREQELAARIALLEKEAAELAGQGPKTTTPGGASPGGGGGHGSDRRLEAENRLYEEKLDRVTTLREDLVVAKARMAAGTGTQSEVEELSAQLTEALQVSSMYANEAYVTRATVLHVVGNQQILGAASSASASTVEIALEAEDYLASANEQVGFIFDDFAREGGDVMKGLLKAGKYIMRLGHAATKVEDAVAQKEKQKSGKPAALPVLSGTPSARQVWTYGEALMKAKDLEPARQLDAVREASGEGWTLAPHRVDKRGLEVAPRLAEVKTQITNFLTRVQALAERLNAAQPAGPAKKATARPWPPPKGS
jgi:hypothetical protein